MSQTASRATTDRRLLITATILLIAIAAALLFVRYLESEPALVDLRAGAAAKPVSIVFVSGDAGLGTWSVGGRVAGELARAGYAVTGIDSLSEFSRRRTPDEAAAILERAMRRAQARNPGKPVVLIGQSFGSDILVVAVDRLSPAARASIARLILIVPGTHAYLQVSPGEVMGIAPPDLALAPLTARLSGLPITCIFGIEERDSLCPSLSLPNVQSVGLPGGHMLNRDSEPVFAAVKKALALPTLTIPVPNANTGKGAPDESL